LSCKIEEAGDKTLGDLLMSTACEKSDYDMIKSLHHNKVALQSENIEEIFDKALQLKDWAYVKAIVEQQPDEINLQCMYHDGMTPIMQAAQAGKRDVVYAILSEDPEAVLQRDKAGKTVGNYASEGGYGGLAKIIDSTIKIYESEEQTRARIERAAKQITSELKKVYVAKIDDVSVPTLGTSKTKSRTISPAHKPPKPKRASNAIM